MLAKRSLEQRFVLYLIILIALLASGCLKEIPLDEPTIAPYDPAQPMSFSAQVEPITRGTPINSVEQMTTMGVFAAATANKLWSATDTVEKMFDVKMSLETGLKWVYEKQPIYWEAKDNVNDKYSFFAYAPYADDDNGIKVDETHITGVPQLTYTVPTTVEDQPDLMVAIPRFNLRPTVSVPLVMKHALTAIGFQIKGHAADYSEEITDISITGVAITGTLAIDGSEIKWTDLKQPTNKTFSVSLKSGDKYTVGGKISDDLLAENGYLMMIPQTLTSEAIVQITFADGSKTKINLATQTWEAGKRVTYNITLTTSGSFTLTPEYTILSNGEHTPATQTLTVISQLSNGMSDETEWTLETKSAWLSLSLSNTGGGTQSITSEGDKTVYLYAASSATERTADITLKLAGVAGSITVTVRQNGNTSTPPQVDDWASTIGAFWRHNQTGERIVKVNTGTLSGAWVAMVTSYGDYWDPLNGDGILLAAGDSEDPFINKKNYGDAEQYQLAGYNYTSSASGIASPNDKSITFRIGLEKPFFAYSNDPDYDDAKPARYAVVELWYNDYKQMRRIYVRQGEGDDYLMQVKDYSARFAPYNLTAPKLDAQVTKIGGDNDAMFTEYPSQVGAFFQWANEKNFNYAWNPYWETYKGTDFEWDTTVPSTFDDKYDISPPGYRRPDDKSGEVQTEVRQSLWLKPSSGEFSDNSSRGPVDAGNNSNCVYGYYSDGFYDRQPIDRKEQRNGVVAAGTRDVAYGGALFFNPYNNASLFFPVGGLRRNDDGNYGTLANEGVEAFYMTRSNTLAGNTLAIVFKEDYYAGMAVIMKAYGHNIRPVLK